tara:strand:- start:862 stop:1335 length:474 start_codon:yes stop_codon:yes gene_type:complete
MSKKNDLAKAQAVIARFEELGCTEHVNPNGDTLMRKSCDFTIKEFAGANGKDSPTWTSRKESDVEFCYVRGVFNCSNDDINGLIQPSDEHMSLARIPKKSYDTNPMELGSCYSAQISWTVTDDEDKLYDNCTKRFTIAVFSNLAQSTSIESLFADIK